MWKKKEEKSGKDWGGGRIRNVEPQMIVVCVREKNWTLVSFERTWWAACPSNMSRMHTCVPPTIWLPVTFAVPHLVPDLAGKLHHPHSYPDTCTSVATWVHLTSLLPVVTQLARGRGHIYMCVCVLEKEEFDCAAFYQR